MSSTKAALRQAKAAIDEHRYEDAAAQAEKVLVAEPQNYHANVLLGLAMDKLDRHDDADRAYQTAIAGKCNEPLAWQGLINLYEKQGQQKVDYYHRAALKLAELYMEADDQNKCQGVVEKYQSHAGCYGTRAQQKRALEILLPSSTFYDFLEGRLPYPSLTYVKIAKIGEDDQMERINKEIGRRRTRLGSTIDQVRQEVRREVLTQSPLERTYQDIIDWTRDDKERREYEEKLLLQAYDTLKVLPLDAKASKRAQVQRLADGIVILKHPFKLAWTISIEWKDGERLASWDMERLKEYIDLFPEDGLAKVLCGYLGSELSLPIQDDHQADALVEVTHRSGNDADADVLLSPEDRLILMADGMMECKQSILAHRLMAEYYQYIEEFESAVELCRQAERLIYSVTQEIGLKYEKSPEAIRIILATSLISYQPPRHFDEANLLFDSILKRNPLSTAALIGKGQLLGEREDYPAALNVLDNALSQKPDDLLVALEVAWYRALCGNNHEGLDGLETCLSRINGTDLRTRRLRAKTLYRIGSCLWRINSSPGARTKRTGAYGRFIGALQADPNFAPAYTSLGIYYIDYAKDKRRARKCFLKAIELSASEVVAAERLARSYADEGDWDLVELVAQRVVECGKTLPDPGSQRGVVSWPLAALGVVQLNRQQYTQSIVSFQHALRISPKDYHSWIGLGESYHNSGRHIAATKAFEQAQRVQGDSNDFMSGDDWFAKLLSANVKRELGRYEEAIKNYDEIHDMRPGEIGVSMALVQTLIDAAWQSIEDGFFGQAAGYGQKTIDRCSAFAEEHADISGLWKTVADACLVFSYAQSYADLFPWREVDALLGVKVDVGECYDILRTVDGVKLQFSEVERVENEGIVPLERCLLMAILAQKRSLHASGNDVHARAVAWYNLAWTEYRAYVCLSASTRDSGSKRPPGYLRAAIYCFRRAIETEAGNSDFWNALGVATSTINPKVSQHSFLRGLFLSDKNPRVWTNYGVLCLLQDDHLLANLAFSRAQAVDPEYSQAWLGQGLLASSIGDLREAALLFNHAWEIADGSLPLAKQLYACSAFDQLKGKASNANLSNLIQPLFALGQLRSSAAIEPDIEHLSALFQERIGNYTATCSFLKVACDAAEQDYEVSESVSALTKFAHCKADQARAYLALHDYDAALVGAETALQLSIGDESGDGPKIVDPVISRKCQLGARLSIALACFQRGSVDEAVSGLQMAIEESEGAADVVCLLAQVLWSTGRQYERKMAVEQLLDCIGREPNHLSSILLLGVTATLGKDQETLDAAIDDLKRLRAGTNLDDGQRRAIQAFLVDSAALSTANPNDLTSANINEDRTDHAMTESQVSVFLSPFDSFQWTRFASFCDDGHESASFPARMALKTAQRAAPPHGSLTPESLAEAFAGTGRAADAQGGIFVAPWSAVSWDALARVVRG